MSPVAPSTPANVVTTVGIVSGGPPGTHASQLTSNSGGGSIPATLAMPKLQPGGYKKWIAAQRAATGAGTTSTGASLPAPLASAPALSLPVSSVPIVIPTVAPVRLTSPVAGRISGPAATPLRSLTPTLVPARVVPATLTAPSVVPATLTAPSVVPATLTAPRVVPVRITAPTSASSAQYQQQASVPVGNLQSPQYQNAQPPQRQQQRQQQQPPAPQRQQQQPPAPQRQQHQPPAPQRQQHQLPAPHRQQYQPTAPQTQQQKQQRPTHVNFTNVPPSVVIAPSAPCNLDATRRNRTPAARVALTQEQLEERIDRTLAGIERKQNIELVYLVDATSSMDPYIAAAKDCCKEVVRGLHLTHPDATLKVAFVAYRDHCDGDTIRALNFTENVTEFEEFVDDIKAFGGGDIPEDVLGGMDSVSELSWSTDSASRRGKNGRGSHCDTARLCIHIADAPPHGDMFRKRGEPARYVDHYPRGGTAATEEPHGLTVDEVIKKFRTKKIKYFFGKIKPVTDTMVDVFSERLGYKVDVFQLPNHGADMHQILDRFVEISAAAIRMSLAVNRSAYSSSSTVNSSAATSLASSASTCSATLSDASSASSSGPRSRHREIVDALPAWDTLPVYNMLASSYELPKSLTDITSNPAFFGKKTDKLRKGGAMKVKRAKTAFSGGAERYSYYGQDLTHASTFTENNNSSSSRYGNDGIVDIVFKEFNVNGRSGNHIGLYLAQAEISTVAQFFALQFNAAMSSAGVNAFNVAKVKFLKVHVASQTIQVTKPGVAPHAIKRFYCVEPFFRGKKFTRFNFNSGHIEEMHDVLEAFVHYTYHASNGYLLICDLQGIQETASSSKTFLLTDPGIHCTDVTRFGSTNFGQRGIDMVLRTHKCSSICRSLGLPKPTISTA